MDKEKCSVDNDCRLVLECDRKNIIAEKDKRIAELEEQESLGMEATLSQMLSKEQAERWGLDEHGHRRNVQLIFMRACKAIDELEAQLAEHEWVSVEDRLPDRGTRNLALFKSGAVMELCDADWESPKWEEEVTHWKTIHLPCEKESNNEM